MPGWAPQTEPVGKTDLLALPEPSLDSSDAL